MDITINTAQNVGITYKPAGLMPRIIATVIDLALLGGVFILGVPSCSIFIPVPAGFLIRYWLPC